MATRKPQCISMPSPTELKAMPKADRKIYLEMSALAMKAAYEKNHDLTAFTALDDADFVDAGV